MLVLFAPLLGSPKFHAQPVTASAGVEASVNWTVKGAVPDVTLVVKSAVGEATTAVMVRVALLLPLALLTVSFAVKVPGVL